MSCIKIVGALNCPYCQHAAIKYGRVCSKQRYRCKICKRTFMNIYTNNAYHVTINKNIVDHLRKGCGIRSIARLLCISANTVMRRIKIIASKINRPALTTRGVYEVDELKTYVESKNNPCWVICGFDRQNKQIVDIKVGKRTKANLRSLIDTLLLSQCASIYTDRLNIYKQIIPSTLHKVGRYGTNRIERSSLTFRTHLKRLGRKTICYSKSIIMLEACLKIYFWV